MPVLIFRESVKKQHGILRTKHRGMWGYWCEGKVVDAKQVMVLRGKKINKERVYDVECEDGVVHRGVPLDMLQLSTNTAGGDGEGGGSGGGGSGGSGLDGGSGEARAGAGAGGEQAGIESDNSLQRRHSFHSTSSGVPGAPATPADSLAGFGDEEDEVDKEAEEDVIFESEVLTEEYSRREQV
jgi:hypothetical protein